MFFENMHLVIGNTSKLAYAQKFIIWP